MERTNIFEIMARKCSTETETRRLIRVFEEEPLLAVRDENFSVRVTLKDFVSSNFFYTWKGKGRCIDADDFFETIDYEDLKREAASDIKILLTLVEVVYNFWHIASKHYDPPFWQKDEYSLDRIKTVLDGILDTCNHTSVYDNVYERLLIVEAKEDVLAVADAINAQLAFDVIRYNHRSMNGDIKSKRQILFDMGRELEKQREVLAKEKKPLCDAIFNMLNNMGIRHGNAHNEEVLEKFSSDELEQWYDELYQMMLLANLGKH